jgi:iron complex transport system ATP-binding protein
MSLLEVKRVEFAYDERPVLRGVSFAVEAGDFVGIVGPNGCGKSTLLDLIVGILKPGGGEVFVKDKLVRHYRRRDIAREVALVPQSYTLGFDLPVRKVVEMGAYCRGGEADSCGDADQAMARLGIAELADRPFPDLSGGEKQMVLLAQALVQQAPVLLLDEPASSLDVSHQLRLFDLLRELNAEGLTVLCVLHDLNMALHYFDKLLVLSDGGVAAWGAAADVARPETLEAVYGVRAFMHHHAGRTFLTFSPRPRSQPRGRVHVVCGGGTGAGLMRELVDAGYEVTAGVVNALDSDEVTGRELGLQMAIEAPFSPIGDVAHEENLALLRAADVVLVAAVPFGHGNARNVEALREALAAGTPVWAAAGVLENDFAGATGELRAAGVEFFAGDAELLAALAERAPLPR